MPLATPGGLESGFFDHPGAVTMETPGKKRKRNAETNPFLNFTDQTFSIPSSTPIHNRQIDGSAFENPSFRVSNKENYNLFSDSCMEVKSIADLANGGGATKRPKGLAACDNNPFEVVRKPPKKKKKQMHQGGVGGGSVSLEESCFENPGLNLAAADKQPVNPFEVPRDGDEYKRKEAEELSRCFVNNALNIRAAESAERFNPFEIVRPKEGTAADASNRALPVPELAGIENPALEMPTYAIAVPFTPSLKHRINFHEVAPNALTPCQMLANMVVCSPDPKQIAAGSGSGADSQNKNATVTLAKRRSLSVISEESDIGEKLDCYQLELENSINEAKARKQRPGGETTPFTFSGTGHRRRSVRRSLIDMKHISNLSQRLHELEDETNDFTKLEDDEKLPDSEEEDKENKQPVLVAEGMISKKEETETEHVEKTVNHSEVTNATEVHCNQMTFTITKETTVREEIRIDVSNPDVQFEEVEDFEDEEQDVELLNNPAPFQRAYRKKEPLVEKLPEDYAADEFKRPQAAGTECRTNAPIKSHKVRDVIRRSFRRLIPRSHEPKGDGDEKQSVPTGAGEGHGLISSIRHSLRRRAAKAKPDGEENNGKETLDVDQQPAPLEMSIIAEQPRAVFRQPSLEQYKPIAVNSGGSGVGSAGGTLRNSLRRSTKDIRKQMMKSVFRKQTGDLDGDHHHGQHVGDLI
uniref:Uncharacterized protein n=1 Tax=Anopheles culicifacies TaxID=139723 RepID=A0A182M1K4_9DIPT